MATRKKAAAKSGGSSSRGRQGNGTKSNGAKGTGRSSRADAKRTTNHDRIRDWVEKRGGSPATVKSTGRSKHPGLLRIDFPGYSGQATLEPITWDDFFQKFDEEQLTFLYQNKTASGKTSRFNKFVDRSSR